MARCFVTRQLPGSALDRLPHEHEVDVWPDATAAHTRAAARADSPTSKGLLCLLTDRIDAELIERARGSQAIANYAVGYDNIDLGAAAARGIPVGNTPDVLTDATADLAFALLLAAARKLPEAMAAVRDGRLAPWEPGEYLGADVHGATLGIIGFGRIGRAVARRAEGFEMRVLHTDSGSDQAALDALLARLRLRLAAHCPLTPETRHLIDAAALAQMKPTAILINTARGAIVDQQALAHALHDGDDRRRRARRHRSRAAARPTTRS